MRLQNLLLLEKHYTGPLYHSTSYTQAMQIVQDGFFKLSDAITRVSFNPELETKHMPSKEYRYFLSTARTKNDTFKRYMRQQVTFVLDSAKYNNKGFTVRPVNFFTNDEAKNKESEERIWSKNPTVGIDNILEIHVLLNAYDENDETGQSAKDAPGILSSYGKENGIPVYIYPSSAKREFDTMNKQYAYTRDFK